MGTSSERLSPRSKLLYGMGDWGFSMTSTIQAVYFPIFLADVVHLDLSLAAAAYMVGRVWDWVNDPIIGYLSDRTRSRWGRRRPFLLFGLVPYALAFMMLWWAPPLGSNVALAVYYGAACFLFDTAATFVYMPYFALTPELTLDYDERTSLTSYRMFFSIAASLVAFTVPGLIIGLFRPENLARVTVMGIIFGITSALPLLGTFLGTRERAEFQQQPPVSIRESLGAVTRNQPFLFAAGIYLFTWMMVDLLQPMLPFFLKYWLGLEPLRDVILGTVFVVAALALPLWAWMAEHWNKRLAYIAGISFLALVMIALALLRPGVPTAAVLALAALAGVGISAAHVLPWSIIPDAIEWDELETGQRHEGAFYSLITLLNKVAASAVIPAAMWLMGRSGYVPNAAAQPAPVLTVIRTMVGGVPALFLLGGIAFAALYPLSRERHLAVRRELEQRRARAA